MVASEDGAGVKPRLEHDAGCPGRLVGIAPPRKSPDAGMRDYSDCVIKAMGDLARLLELPRAAIAHALMGRDGLNRDTPLAFAAFGASNSRAAAEVALRWLACIKRVAPNVAKDVALCANGDSKLLKAAMAAAGLARCPDDMESVMGELRKLMGSWRPLRPEILERAPWLPFFC